MKLVMMMVAVFAVAAPAFAGGENGGSDSCGLGWQVTNKKSMLATSTRGT
ncbi:hypothetical protein GUG03_08100, partial [Xanthomonas citri pv. citri]|nr:hypothetical protein [Xanthomonas citri pv. citri]